MGMNKRRCPGLVLLCILLQIDGGLAEWQLCKFGFTDENYHFSVPKSLEVGTVLGEVVFEKCEEPTIIHYDSEDPDFKVQADGSITVKNHVELHGHRTFCVVALNENDLLSSTTVTLKIEHAHHKQAEHARHANAEHGLRRQKRDWIIPPIAVSENERGPFPKKIIQIKSSRASEIRVLCSITGQGADTPPVGVFTMESTTGWLYVTKPLNREEIPSYTVFVHAVSSSGAAVEHPIDITIRILDQNDNRPEFTQAVFIGEVPEGSKPGTAVMNVTATDADDSVYTNNGIVWYSIIDQEPNLPHIMMFTINPESGLIRVEETGLDRENYSQYTLTLQATDQEGSGFTAAGKAVITVTDANDNPPIFYPNAYTVQVPENEVGFEVARLIVTDDDTPNTDAWRAVYKIIKGNEANLFGITTTEDNMGLLTTIKELNYELKNEYILSVVVTNIAIFAVPLITSTAIVTVTVLDANEAPLFVPPLKQMSVIEDLPSGQEVASYTAQDPDKAQKIRYHIGNDPAGWLTVNLDNGIIIGNGQLDRESMFVKNNIYKAIILAVDNGMPPATGTGTLQLHLLDVNDHGPFLEFQDIIFCQKNPKPLSIPIVDRDETPFTDPYTAEIPREARENWAASVMNNQFQIKPSKTLEIYTYSFPVTLADSQGLKNTSILGIRVCHCEGGGTMCESPKTPTRGLGIAVIVGILGGILALLILLLFLLLFVKGKPLLPPKDGTCDTVYYYDVGLPEEDQDINLSQPLRGLDARVDIIHNNVAPTLMAAPQYQTFPANPDEIGNLNEENLQEDNNDPTASNITPV